MYPKNWKQVLKQIFAHKCSQQHHSQQPKGERWKQPKCSPTDKSINKMWYPNNGILSMGFSILLITRLCNHHIYFPNMFITPKKTNPVPIRGQSPQAKTSTLRVYASASGHFIWTESYTMWSSVTGLFHIFKVHLHGSMYRIAFFFKVE